jgi:hypothetical protein
MPSATQCAHPTQLAGEAFLASVKEWLCDFTTQKAAIAEIAPDAVI